MPIHLHIELTNYCELRCPVCPTGTGIMERPTRAMDPELLKRLMEEAGPYLLTASLWGWGEPLLHPQLSRVLQIMGGHRVATFLSTNGQSLLNDGVVQALVDFPPTHLIVAIDGLTDDTNAMYRVGARLEPVLEGVQRLKEMKRQRSQLLPLLHMRYIVMRHNQHEIPRLEGFAREHGFDLLTVRTLSIIDEKPEDSRHGEYIPESGEFRAYSYENGARIRRNDRVCFYPFWFPAVCADGTVTACEQDYNATEPMGALDEGVSFRDIWFSSGVERLRRAIRNDSEGLGFCANCPNRDRPTTDTSIRAVRINRDIPDPVVIG
jgi:MoaA/NifB/PqqE/SkfB family radical SAM enzyme